MDVTLLLNQSGGPNGCKNASRESTPQSATGGEPTLPSTALPTPSPERSSPQREAELRHGRGRTPWNAGGYSLPLHSEAKFPSASTFSFRSASEQFDSDTTYHTPTGTSMHSSNGSMDWDTTSSRDATPSFPRPQPVRALTVDLHQRHADASDRRESISTIRTNGSDGILRPPFWDERRGAEAEPSTPPRHKFSDSHSSLSSYGSWQSRCHSRISSATTVSGGHLASSSLTELPILESRLGEHEDSRRRPVLGDKEAPLSAAMARPQLPASIETNEPGRPGSPSDAVLNMKGPARHGPNWESPSQPFLSRAAHTQLFSSPKLHKRATSAPDFAPASAYLPSHSSKQAYAVLPPPHRAMAMSSNSPRGAFAAAARDRREGRELVDVREDEAADTRSSAVGPDSSPELGSHGPNQQSLQDDEAKAVAAMGEKEEPRCMFVANCDTGSQLRKAISHLFGRNKSCTLKIPKEVWVYYCRKHYQRIRYRNARTYPSNQMELVKVQIRRLQTWSEGNRAKGSGPYIKQWTLSLRKREQNRLESGRGALEEGDDEQVVAAQGGGSAVPDWIIQLLGDGHTTDRMLDIAQRLHKDVAEGVLSQVPEIEFLPDIVDDDQQGAAAKPARARRQNSANGGSKMPKRKARDMPDASRQDSGYGDGAVSDPPGEEDEDVTELVSPSGKRARIERATGVPYHASSDLPPAMLARSMHPYMVPAAYGGGSSAPPRAPKVVPKMRPLEYGQGPAAAQAEYDHQGAARFTHPHNGPQGGVYNGHGPARYGDAQQLPLPSISAQMMSMPSRVHGMRFGGNRPMHQRSASAYTPASRHLPPAFARPSSSGTGAQAAPSRFGFGDARAGAAGGYGTGSHGGHWHQQPQYGQGPGWAAAGDYGHGHASQQHGFQQSPMYGQAPRQATASPPRPSPSYSMAPAFHSTGNGA